MKKKIFRFILSLFITFLFAIPHVYAASNPYGKYQTLYGVKTISCTWYAWQQAYEHTGVALPGWGNAQTWYNSAINAGYKVGSEAKANSIAVWSSSDGYGHVGFVVSVDGNIMTVNEAGIVTDENEGVVNGSQKYTTAGNLIGFIYLEEAPTNTNNNVSNNPSNNTSNNNSTKKSSNNNLTDLTIDVEEFSFDEDILEYNLEVDYETQIIHIAATPEDEEAIVTGTGDKALQVGENNYWVIVTAEDGTTKEYKLTIIRNEQEKENEETLIEDSSEDDGKNNSNFVIYIIAGIVGIVLIIIIVTRFVVRKRGKK